MTRGTVLLLLALVASGAAPPGATVVGADSVSNGVASAAAAAAAQVQAQAQAQEQQPPPPQQQQQKPAAEMPVVEWGSDVGVEAQHGGEGGAAPPIPPVNHEALNEHEAMLQLLREQAQAARQQTDITVAPLGGDGDPLLSSGCAGALGVSGICQANAGMQYRSMGRTGLKISALGFGAWATFGRGTLASADAVYGMMRYCVRRGVNFFDNAELWHGGEAERLMGGALARLVNEDGVPREALVVATKIFQTTTRRDARGPNDIGLSRKRIVEGLRASLRRLRLDYVDVVFAHRPDPTTPIEETVRAMNHVIDRGWAYYWGTSEWSTDQLLKAHAIAKARGLIGPAVEQPQYSLLWRDRVEREYAPAVEEHGMGLTAWSPLASGILTGKYGADGGAAPPPGSRMAARPELMERTGKWRRALRTTEALRPIAAKLNCSLAQFAIAWTLHNPAVSSTLLGATSIAQLEENFGALALLPRFTDEVVQQLDETLCGLGHVCRMN